MYVKNLNFPVEFCALLRLGPLFKLFTLNIIPILQAPKYKYLKIYDTTACYNFKILSFLFRENGDRDRHRDVLKILFTYDKRSIISTLLQMP